MSLPNNGAGRFPSIDAMYAIISRKTADLSKLVAMGHHSSRAVETRFLTLDLGAKELMTSPVVVSDTTPRR